MAMVLQEAADNWTTQLRKGVLELCILNIIGRSRVYGYDIVKQLRGVDALVGAGRHHLPDSQPPQTGRPRPVHRSKNLRQGPPGSITS